MRSALRLLKMTLPMLCTIAVVGAQAPAPDTPGAQQPNSPPAAPATQAAQPGKITYTGCLKPGVTAEDAERSLSALLRQMMTSGELDARECGDQLSRRFSES